VEQEHTKRTNNGSSMMKIHYDDLQHMHKLITNETKTMKGITIWIYEWMTHIT
jgi:hypothetical protein